MQKTTHLSPTSIALYQQDKEAFYLQYLADHKRPREPQTRPMSIGSAFDAYVKSYLHARLCGTNAGDYELEALLASQVEPQNRDWAREQGSKLFEQYKKSGRLADLMLELETGTEVQFEFEVRGTVKHAITRETGGMVLLGRPDCYYRNKGGYRVILDWKVNGYCNHNRAIYPVPGYLGHRNAVAGMTNGMIINIACGLEDREESWARQLAIYGWLLGEEVGSGFLVAVDQITGSPPFGFKFSQHRYTIGARFQHDLYEIARELWLTVHSDHFFRDMSREESLLRCQDLDIRYNPGNMDQDFLNFLNPRAI